MDLFELIRIVWDKKWYVIIVPLISLVLAFFLTKQLPKEYKSSSRISTGFIENSNIQITEESFDFRKTQIKFNNLIELMNSEIILTMLSYRLAKHDLEEQRPFRIVKDSIKTYLPVEKFDSVITAKLDRFLVLQPGVEVDSLVIEALREVRYLNWQLRKEISIWRVRDTDYIAVECTTNDPYLSAFISNAIAEETIRYDSRNKNTFSNQSIEFFQGLVDEKEGVVIQKRSELNSLLRQNGLSSEAEYLEAVGKISQFRSQLDDERLNKYKIELSIDDLERQRSLAGSNTTANEAVVSLRSQINQLNQVYIETGSSDTTIRATIDELRAQLRVEMNNLASGEGAKDIEEIDRELNSLKIDLEVSNSTIANLTSRIVQLEGNVRRFSSADSRIEGVQKELDEALLEYEEAVDRVELEKNKSIISNSTIQLVIRGQPNFESESKKELILVVLAFVSSFMITVMVIVGLGLFDTKISSIERFERKFPFQLIGKINQLSQGWKTFTKLSSAKKLSRELNNFVQDLRKIRFEITNSNNRVFLFSSLKAGEGKSFIMTGMAYAIALLDKKVLILDSNFKNNTLSRYFGAPGDENFLLASGDKKIKLYKKSRDDAFRELSGIISKTKNPNVDIIKNQGGMGSPMEIFVGKDFGQMIDILKEQYDFILLEGPELNSYPDSKELAQFVDKMVLIVSANSTISSTDKESLKYLHNLGTKLWGGILNGVEKKKGQ